MGRLLRPAPGCKEHMKVIDVDKQVRLSLAKTVELVLSGVRFRLFRAIITVVIISLAVAFLMAMLSASVVARKLMSAIEEQTAPRRLFVAWGSRLTKPMRPGEITMALAEIEPGGDRWQELKGWGKLDEPQLARLADAARLQLIYDDYFKALGEAGDLRALVGRAQGEEIYIHLADADSFKKFVQARSNVGRVMPGSDEELQAFVAAWPEVKALRDAVFAGHAEATRLFGKNLLGEMPRDVFLATAEDSLVDQVAVMGFRMTIDELAIVREQAALVVDAERISSMIKAPSVRNSLKGRLKKESATDVGPRELFALLRSDRGAGWFLDELGRIGERIIYMDETSDVKEATEVAQLNASRQAVFGFDLPIERIKEVAAARLEALKLDAVEAKVVGGGEGLSGFSSRTIAIICVSFLVCMVGVINAMLMSVAERFQEIATMKCLGATDGFIMVNFMLESCVQGVAGGIVGSVLGLLLGMLLGWIRYGSMAITHMPIGDVSIAAGVAFVLGVVLSMLAAVYPALVAARLAPMEAMRIE